MRRTNRVLYGSPGVGNLLHLAAELFNIKAGVKMEHVPYKGASEVLTALLQGSIQVMFVTPTSAIDLVKDGKLRALATTGAKPMAEFPDLPLLSATVPAYPPSVSWGMVFAPAKTPVADRRQAQRRHPARAHGAGGGRRHAEVRLRPRRPQRRADCGILPRAGRRNRRGGARRRSPN